VNPEVLKPLYETLHRYAGWLDRQRASVTVRADVQAIGTAIESCVDPTPLLLALDQDLARLPSGALRKMLRVASARIRQTVADQYGRVDPV
jgi:hypothetical protein